MTSARACEGNTESEEGNTESYYPYPTLSAPPVLKHRHAMRGGEIKLYISYINRMLVIYSIRT